MSALNQISSEQGNRSLISFANVKGRALMAAIIKVSTQNIPNAIHFLISSFIN
jgi:hypothetical protein